MYHIKNDKRSIQSSQWIFEALEQLMLEKEYSQIKIIEITNKAKLGRTTFYRNFETIDDVLRMKCDEKFQGLKDYFMQYYKEEISAKNNFFLKPFLRYWYDNSNIIDLIIKANRLDLIKTSFVNMINYYKNLFPDNNQKHFDHLNYFIEIRLSISIGVLTEWIKNDKNIPPDELSEIIISQLKEPMDFLNNSTPYGL